MGKWNEDPRSNKKDKHGKGSGYGKNPADWRGDITVTQPYDESDCNRDGHKWKDLPQMQGMKQCNKCSKVVPK